GFGYRWKSGNRPLKLPIRPVAGAKRQRWTASDTAGNQEIGRLNFLYAAGNQEIGRLNFLYA
ncbi:MAG: hypothetical protein JJU31_13775, partial [Wenzhouxiangella sp.]|nr:hypothetical protein [Wenzhouxiangella sp.]